MRHPKSIALWQHMCSSASKRRASLGISLRERGRGPALIRLTLGLAAARLHREAHEAIYGENMRLQGTEIEDHDGCENSLGRFKRGPAAPATLPCLQATAITKGRACEGPRPGRAGRLSWGSYGAGLARLRGLCALGGEARCGLGRLR